MFRTAPVTSVSCALVTRVSPLSRIPARGAWLRARKERHGSEQHTGVPLCRGAGRQAEKAADATRISCRALRGGRAMGITCRCCALLWTPSNAACFAPTLSAPLRCLATLPTFSASGALRHTISSRRLFAPTHPPNQGDRQQAFYVQPILAGGLARWATATTGLHH